MWYSGKHPKAACRVRLRRRDSGVPQLFHRPSQVGLKVHRWNLGTFKRERTNTYLHSSGSLHIPERRIRVNEIIYPSMVLREISAVYMLLFIAQHLRASQNAVVTWKAVLDSLEAHRWPTIDPALQCQGISFRPKAFH